MLRHIDWEDCTKRDLEIEGVKKDRVWKQSQDGTLKAAVVDTSSPQASVGTDLLLRNCLQRRGMVLEMGDLLDFFKHELLINLLLSEYLREPPEGFMKITIEQLRRADKECFKLLAQKCRSGIRRGSDGLRPMDKAFDDILRDPAFRMLLMPLPRGGASKRGRDNSPDAGGRKAGRKDAERIKQLENQLRNLHAKGGDSKGKSKGAKGKRDRESRGTPSLPQGLIGKNYKTSKGEPLCFNFNLQGCSDAKPGGRCRRGHHLCAEPGCEKAHSLKDHS